jgi:hypothetical protein
MTKFGKSEKTGLSGLLFQNIQFQQFQSKPEERVKLEDLKIQGVLKQEFFFKRHQETKMEANQARSQSHKNRTIQFAKLDSPVFPE